MAMNVFKAKSRSESGRFAGIPHACMEHENYISLNAHAKVLLLEFCKQYNGFNNGDLSASFKTMKKRGFRSKGTLDKALKELKAKGWIVVSRYGGRNTCNLYALTFHAIDDCKGKLNIKPTPTAPGTWKKLNSAPAMCINELAIRPSSDN